MNRKNIWIHVTIAVVLITLAALMGQIERWKSALRGPNTETTRRVEKTVPVAKKALEGTPEVIVRFRPGFTLDKIRAIASTNNDSLTDEIEAVNGLTFIDDLDNADAQAVANQYSAMTSAVLYAEVNLSLIHISEPTRPY